MKVVLLGYMGSGKSTVGKVLSSRLGISFIDLDSYIEKKEEKSISKIFEDEGEIYFRKKEHEYLKVLLKSEEDFVLSLGGGTPCYTGNMDSILKYKLVKSIYLNTNIKTLLKRLRNGKKNRPLISELSDDKLNEFIAKHLFERRFFYEQANFNIKVDDKSVSELVAEIRMLLH